MRDSQEPEQADLWLVVETPPTFDWNTDTLFQLFDDRVIERIQTFYPGLQVACVTPAFTILTMKIPAAWELTRGGPLGTLVRIQEERTIRALRIVPPRGEEGDDA